MTPQEMLDKAYKGVLDQGGPSREGHVCLYRGPNGKKCAVGHLVDDETCENWDGATHTPCQNTSISSIIASFRNVPNFIMDNEFFLTDLQVCHDGLPLDLTMFEKEWNIQIDKLADKYDLESPVQKYEDL